VLVSSIKKRLLFDSSRKIVRRATSIDDDEETRNDVTAKDIKREQLEAKEDSAAAEKDQDLAVTNKSNFLVMDRSWSSLSKHHRARRSS
jgi:hypothetical protein